MPKKKSTKVPQRDESGAAETPKEYYKDTNARQRAANSPGNTGRWLVGSRPTPVVTAKVSRETQLRVHIRATQDANAVSGKNVSPRTGPSSGSGGSTSEARYNRLTGGGLRDLDR